MRDSLMNEPFVDDSSECSPFDVSQIEIEFFAKRSSQGPLGGKGFDC